MALGHGLARLLQEQKQGELCLAQTAQIAMPYTNLIFFKKD